MGRREGISDRAYRSKIREGGGEPGTAHFFFDYAGFRGPHAGYVGKTRVEFSIIYDKERDGQDLGADLALVIDKMKMGIIPKAILDSPDPLVFHGLRSFFRQLPFRRTSSGILIDYNAKHGRFT